MPTAPPVSARARKLAETFAARLRTEPTARKLWVLEDDGQVELWLLTAPTDVATTLRLHTFAYACAAAFPELTVQLHVLNPAWYSTGDPTAALPFLDAAEQVPLPAD
jgi:hypothetical protein